MTILAVALVMICLGSVSAVEEIDLNSTMETVNDISQDENIVINEIADYADTDDNSQRENSVGTASEKQENENLLKASDNEDALGADTTGYISIRETNTETDGSFEGAVGEEIGIDLYWRSLSGMKFSLLVNDVEDQSFYPSGYGYAWSDTLYYTPQTAGQYTFQVICQGSSTRYVSNILTWDISGSAKTETETSISIASSSVAPNEEFTINYNVYEKGTTNAVNEGTISFYDQNGQIGSSINLANPSTFTYRYSNKNSYRIYAVYSATDNYKGSQSSEVKLAVKDDSDSVSLKIVSVYSSSDNLYLACEDDYASFGTYANTAARYNVVVTFAVESSSEFSTGTIEYGTSTLSSNTFSGTNPTLSFSRNDVGENTVHVTVNGVESNSVTINVLDKSLSKASSISITPTSGNEGQTITLTPTVMSPSSYSTGYQSVELSGIVTIYSSNTYSDEYKLGTVSTDGGSFVVPLIDTNSEYEDFTYYATFAGEYGSSFFITPTSNSFSFRIYNVPDSKDTSVSLTPEGPITIEQGNSQNIAAAVTADGQAVTTGTITYYDGDDPISGYTDVSISTQFNTAGLSVGTHNIKVKYNGADGYKASEFSNIVNVVVEAPTSASIAVTSPTYPTHAVATLTGKSGQTYTIRITGRSTSFDVTIPDGETQQTQDLGLIDAGDYEVTVDGEDATATFSVAKATPTLTVTATGNNTSINEAHSITVNSDVEGKITINGGSQQYDIGQAITLSDLSSGSNSIAVKLTPNDTTNYENAEKTVTFVIEKQTLATTVVLYMDTDSVTGSSSISATPHVYDVNGNEVLVGDVRLVPSDNYNSNVQMKPAETKTILTNNNNINNGKYTLTVNYLGGNDDNYIYEASSTSVKYYRVSYLTSIALEVNGETEVTVYVGDTVTLSNVISSASTYADPNEITTILQLLVDGVGGSAGAYPNNDTTIEITEDLLGDHTFAVYYPAENSQNVNLGYYGYRYGSSTSNNVTIHVKNKEIPAITLDVNESVVARGDKVKFNVTVTSNGNDVEEGTVSFYYSNDTLIDSVDLASKDYIELDTSALTKGITYSVYAKYVANNKYGDNTSASKSFTVKEKVNLVLTIEGKTSLDVGYGIDYDLFVESDVDGISVDLYDGEYFDSYDVNADFDLSWGSNEVGEHDVYVKFNGNDEYLPAESHISVNVLQTSTPDRLNINPNYGVEESSVTVTPTVDYSRNAVYNIPGILTLYSDENRQNILATVNTSTGETFLYEVPQTSSSESSSAKYIYAKFEGIYNNVYYFSESLRGIFYIENENSFTLTDKDGNGGTIVIEKDGSVTLKADIDYYRGSSANSYVLVYVNDENVANFTVNYWQNTELNNLELSFKDYVPGEYTVFAKYLGYTNTDYGYYYAPAESNKLTVKVKDINNIVIGVTSSTYPDNVTITVNATVAGVYNVKIGDKVIPVEANGTGVSYRFGASETAYVATVDDWTGDDYDANVTDASFTVSKGINNVAVSVEDVTLPDGVVVVKVTADVAGTYTVKLNDTANTEVTVEITQVNVETAATVTPALPAGHYSANATFAGGENYTVSITNATFDVKKSINDIKVEVTAGTYPDNVTVKVTATLPGDYKVDINGVEYTVTANSTGKSIKLGANHYYANITGDYTTDDYDFKTTNATFDVEKAVNDVEVIVEDKYLPGSVVIKVKANVGGTYNVILNDTFNTVVPVIVDENGEGTATVLLKAGKYSANTTFDDNENYTISIVNDTFDVKKSSIALTIHVDQILYGNNVTGTINTNVSGKYTINIAGNEFELDLSEGDNQFERYIILDVKEAYKANVSISEQDDYLSGFANTTFDVVQTQTDYKANSSKDEYDYGEDVILIISELPDDATGKVTFKYSNGTSAGEIENILSQKQLNLGKLNANSYTIIAQYSGDLNYDGGATKTITFKVNPVDNEITVTVDSVTYPNNVTVIVTATVDGDYVIDINGVDYTVSANGEGKSIKLAAGSYYANITYKNTNYDVFTNNATFTVSPAINVVNVIVTPEVEYKQSITITVKADVADTYHVVIDEKHSADIVVDGETHEGSQTIDLNLAVANDYAATTEWENVNYTTTIINGKFNVTPKVNVIVVTVDEDVVYGGSITVTVTADVPDVYTVNVEGKEVKVNVTDKSQSNSTTLDLDVGENYNAKLSWSNVNYTAQITNVTFNVVPAKNTATVRVDSVEYLQKENKSSLFFHYTPFDLFLPILFLIYLVS